MDPMTRWISQGKTDGPWDILDIVGNGNGCTYHLNERVVRRTEDNWSVKVAQGSAQSENISDSDSKSATRGLEHLNKLEDRKR